MISPSQEMFCANPKRYLYSVKFYAFFFDYRTPDTP
jgi:hypothetical protein